MIPHPSRLFELYEQGRLSREELHAALDAHARELIAEMLEARANPVAAMFDGLLSRHAAHRLAVAHGEHAVRVVLRALADVPDFPPSRRLWNALHEDVPLHCFLRTRLHPVFRLNDLTLLPLMAGAEVEYSQAGDSQVVRESIVLRRKPGGPWVCASRIRL